MCHMKNEKSRMLDIKTCKTEVPNVKKNFKTNLTHDFCEHEFILSYNHEMTQI